MQKKEEFCATHHTLKSELTERNDTVKSEKSHKKKESNLHSIDLLSNKNLVTIFTLQAKLVVDDES